MKKIIDFDVIIIGGSYSGLAAAMALGRALRKVLVIDAGKPCNRPTPYSHNFLTHDGKRPGEIASLARQQVQQYNTVKFINGSAVSAAKTSVGFEVQLESGEVFTSEKLILATGIKDKVPDIDGFAGCWGISVLHCPYCHGYEVRQTRTGILGNDESVFEFAAMISNWTDDLTLFTNGEATFDGEHKMRLEKKNITIIKKRIAKIVHSEGRLQQLIFEDGNQTELNTLYTRPPFEQDNIAGTLGCEFTIEGYVKTDSSQKTNIAGVYACGDNCSRLRTLANAISLGTTAGMMVNKEMVLERFQSDPYPVPQKKSIRE